MHCGPRGHSIFPIETNQHRPIEGLVGEDGVNSEDFGWRIWRLSDGLAHGESFWSRNPIFALKIMALNDSKAALPHPSLAAMTDRYWAVRDRGR
jgi:hypothetical protein